ncbi:GNAT family N-acetyltransferase [Yinghuangia seranimata]|uniref:GNAT family N-acetyltransferase n=1 Tax=Yinghuangia seranimata TaxID=408067 RepID=UPI00248BEA25|nr:GNAT family N-acetyltransferase [Yinghuangia seranimata]MDI2132683.1 GNAT family N-acetyltransferase [Yinghuangia seranimata]
MTTTLRPAPHTTRPVDGAGDWYAICANGRPIGRLHLDAHGRWGDGTGWIDHVEVLASRRRHGHGCVALLAAEEILRGRGCGRVAVEVPEGNLPGLRLAATLGYAFDSRYLVARVRGGIGAARSMPDAPRGLTLAPMTPDEHAAWTDDAWLRCVTLLSEQGWSLRHAEARAHARLRGGEQRPYALRTPTHELAGVVWLDSSPTTPGRAEVRALEVPTPWRGRSHGRLLLRTAEHLAYAAGLGELGLELVGPVPAARHIATAMGYRTQSRQLGKPIL